MSGTLRHIALTVEQTSRTGYGWLLIESAGGRVFVLKKSTRSYGTYMGALDAGYQELAALSAAGMRQAEEQREREPAEQDRQSIELAESHDAL